MDKHAVTNCLAVCQLDRANRLADVGLIEMFADKNEIASFVKALKSAAVEKTMDFYLTENNGWVSIFSEQFSFETVKDYACRYFSEMSNPVITVGYFDDDVLEIVCMSGGEVVTSFVKGPGLDAYGLIETDMDFALFAGCCHADQQKVTDALAGKDIYENCVALGNQLGIPLHLQLRDIKRNAERVTFHV